MALRLHRLGYARAWRRLAALMAIAALLIPPRAALACGLEFPQAVFVHTPHPDFPLERFAAGELGILQPTYARSYLVVAYRYLTGNPLPAAEQKGAAELWRNRLAGGPDAGPAVVQENSAGASVHPFQEWYQIRRTVPVAMAAAPSYADVAPQDKRRMRTFSFFHNCLDDAYRTAAATLRSHIEQFGANHDGVRQWAVAQDRVFTNCNSLVKAIPVPAGPALPELLKKDRSYQIAAAHFYAEEFAEARERFRAISQDEKSPWRVIAALLVARSYLREATLVEGPPNQETLALAVEELERIQNNPALAAVHASAQRLQSFAHFRMKPEPNAAALAARLHDKTENAAIRDTLGDYTKLLDAYLDEQTSASYVPPEERIERLRRATERVRALRSADEMTDWVLNFQASSPEETAHAVARWQQTRSPLWLVAALAKISSGHEQADSLIAAAEKVPAASPAYASAIFHALRLRTERGETEDVRTRLDAVLKPRGAALPPSARNLFLALRTRVATNLDDFLLQAARRPAAILLGNTDREVPAVMNEWLEKEWGSLFKNEELQWDADGARTLTERLPLPMVLEAARNEKLPARLRRDVARAAWVRAALLDHEAAPALASELVKLFPEVASLLKNYLTAGSAEARRFAAALALLRLPGFDPTVRAGVGRLTDLSKRDPFRDNWWCKLGPATNRSGWSHYVYENRVSRPLQSVYPQGEIPAPSFLTAEQRAAGEDEWKRLGELPTGPNLLASIVTEWAKKNVKDPRAPEALHLAVRATRYGCADAETGRYSREAFRVLHRNFPGSEWARKTPYWYGE